jgi:hypothetical protein
MKKFLWASAALVSLLVMGFMPAHLEAFPGRSPAAVPDRQFTREEYMVLNLDRGPDSTGTHVKESLKEVKEMVKELDKGLRQLQQVDIQFAKSKGRPDDRFLTPAAERLQAALKAAQQLEQDLTATRDELKDSIHQALIMAPQQNHL